MTTSLLAARLALGPILLPQAYWLKRNALRLAEAPGPREGVAGDGEPVLRVLVFGDSAAAGVGVADQAQALALPLAQGLRQKLGAPVGWQLVARTGLNTREAREQLIQEAAPADVVVTSLGVNDVTSQSTAPSFLEDLSALWSALRARTGARWAVFSGLPPMHLLSAIPFPLRWYLGRYADWLDAALERWTREQDLGYCKLRWSTDPAALAADGFHPGPALHAEWSRRLADMIAAQPARWARA